MSMNERVLIQQEIAKLKAKRSEDRKMIQNNFSVIIDQLNPFKKIQCIFDHTLDQLNNKLNLFNPIAKKVKSWFRLV